MKMKYLFILRHERADEHGFLTPEGKASIEHLAAQLNHRYGFSPDATTVICSLELRAMKTAQRIIKVIGLEEEHDMCHGELFSNDIHCDPDAALEVVKKYADRVETLFVVTHSEMIGMLPYLFWTKVLGHDEDLPFIQRNYGQGYGFSCVSRKYELIG